MNQIAKRYVLFTTPFCPSCPAVKEYAKNLKLEGKVVDATDDYGSKQAIDFGVASVPTMIFFDEKDTEIGRAHNVSSIKSFLSD